ncbi:MAG: M20 family metallopeptidase [Dehalococcoidales bacterium]|jgi:amidohydrolase|nr:M20 family metallopeptidase [Dehalococcoidales bacterium]
MDTSRLKSLIVDEVEAARKSLSQLSSETHSDPELGFQEVRAAHRLTLYLRENGFSVEPGVCQLPTAFKASYGTGRPIIAILAEYDALPEIGHGCGHNIISTSAVGAGVAAKLAVDQFGGSIIVMGTPAEEMYGGKVVMTARGAFNDIDAAMMVHPGVDDTATTQALACQTLNIEFFGKSVHAAARPEEGINALEAMLLSFSAINSLRQHIRSTARVHGIITAGGEVANVVPAYSAGNFIVRALEDDYLDELKERILNCFEGAAAASGARLEYRWGERYATMCNNLTMAGLFVGNMKTLGRDISVIGSDTFSGSTDMGNVSHVVPGIHAFVAIAGKEILLHSGEFAAAAVSDRGVEGMLDAAKALAMTVVDLVADPDMLASVREEFEQSK